MANLSKIAFRNLLRYKRRTLLTASLVTIGVVFVLLFISISGSFKNMMIGQMTDSMLGHLEVHRRGYLASIDNLPLNLNLKLQAYQKLEGILKQQPDVEAFSPRIKFGGMFSTFVETTNIRLNGVYPDLEFKTVPLLPSRLMNGGNKSLQKGEIWVPDLMSTGMESKDWRHSGHYCHEPGWLRQRKTIQSFRHPGKRHRTGRKRWLHPY